MTKCLTCGRAPLSVRGVCLRCYNRHAMAVFRGTVTWQELERKGLALPSKKSGHWVLDRGRWRPAKGGEGREMGECRSCRAAIPIRRMSRGVCLTCYNRHLRAVRHGRVTWAELERQGLALPAKYRLKPQGCRGGKGK